MKRTIIAACLLLSMLSCRSAKQPILTSKQAKTIIKEIPRDSTVTIPADRSSFRAELISDQTGKVAIKEVLNKQAGKRAKAPQVHLADGLLQVDCLCDSASIYLNWKEKHITDMLQETIYVPTEKPLSSWQQTQIWLGRSLMMLMGGLFVILALSNYRNR
ncbi:MAG: hypothetical protein E6Q66_01140 [Pedobacter sp.]|nr:MAG: hypothetical protein E6Q66_01140 [Pedobacter sp.]